MYTGEFVEWYGQDDVMMQVAPFLEHEKPFPHTLLLGEPGLGKTNLAKYVAYKRRERFQELLAPARLEDIPNYGIVLIDEVHNQRKPEPLFEVMKGQVPTIMAATTRPDVVDKAFRSRFFLELHLKPYKAKAMGELIAAHLSAPEETVDILSTAAAGNPRQAKRLVEVAKRLDTTDPSTILRACQVTADGLTDMHINYLRVLERQGRPIGLSQTANLMYADETTIRSLERLLLEQELINLTPNGRTITKMGQDYLDEFDS